MIYKTSYSNLRICLCSWALHIIYRNKDSFIKIQYVSILFCCFLNGFKKSDFHYCNPLSSHDFLFFFGICCTRFRVDIHLISPLSAYSYKCIYESIVNQITYKWINFQTNSIFQYEKLNMCIKYKKHVLFTI